MATQKRVDERRFAFGENWQRFLAEVDEERVDVAVASVSGLLGVDDLHGMSFLDAGCGSGLFSLAAVRLGAARVHSFDYDVDSVAATRALQERAGESATVWTIERGDATDSAYCAQLGAFDVVYSWGVLHHTGSMWRALENVCECVSAGGRLVVSIYNDQRWRSAYWLGVKHGYNRLPAPLRAPYVALVMAPTEAAFAARSIARGRFRPYVESWTRPRERGMSKWRDMVDWVGGYPFEVAKPEEVFRFVRDRGFTLDDLTTQGGSLGCNEFVFRRAGSDTGAAS